MQWCRYSHDGTVSFGLLDGQDVDEVDGSPFDGYIATGVRRRLAEIRLLTPCLPPTFYCAGLNYKAHIQRMGRAAEKNSDTNSRPARYRLPRTERVDTARQSDRDSCAVVRRSALRRRIGSRYRAHRTSRHAR